MLPSGRYPGLYVVNYWFAWWLVKELVNNLLHCFFQELQYFNIHPWVRLLFIMMTELKFCPLFLDSNINLNNKLHLLELLPLSQWFTIAKTTAKVLSPFAHISECHGTDHGCQKCPEFNVEVSGLKVNQTTRRLKCICALQHLHRVSPPSAAHPPPPRPFPLCHCLKQVIYLSPALLYPFSCPSGLMIGLKCFKLLWTCWHDELLICTASCVVIWLNSREHKLHLSSKRLPSLKSKFS